MKKIKMLILAWMCRNSGYNFWIIRSALVNRVINVSPEYLDYSGRITDRDERSFIKSTKELFDLIEPKIDPVMESTFNKRMGKI